MKLIHNFKSPNYNNRKSKSVELVIIHYTAIVSASKSIKYLCSKKNRVSSHYLISKKGQIYSLVSEKKRAWHAGKSYWNGKTDINSISIGIELDYFPNNKDNKFSKILIETLYQLLKKLIKKYNIENNNILGHSDIAPYRKIDPGKNFPWHFFESKKVAYRINKLKNFNSLVKLLNKWFAKHNFLTRKKKILFMLDYIGYDISLALQDDIYFKKIQSAYINRFRVYNESRLNKKKIMYILEHHYLNKILTK